MNTQFQDYIAQLQPLLDRLTNSAGWLRDDFRGMPEQGIYVFYERGRPIWAGRSDHLRTYLRGQGNPGGDNFTAPIAFGFAKKAAIAAGYPFPTNREAIHDARFIQFFAPEKERVAAMRVRVVEVTDSVLQSLMVIYVSLELKTLNEFGTH